MGEGSHKGQVSGVQIPAGEDQLHPLQPFAVQVVPQPGALVVGQRQNFHRFSSPFSGLTWSGFLTEKVSRS